MLWTIILILTSYCSTKLTGTHQKGRNTVALESTCGWNENGKKLIEMSRCTCDRDRLGLNSS
jgi:hypothetical protein